MDKPVIPMIMKPFGVLVLIQDPGLQDPKQLVPIAAEIAPIVKTSAPRCMSPVIWATSLLAWWTG